MHLVNNIIFILTRGVLALGVIAVLFILFPIPVFAAENSEVTSFVSQALQTLFIIGSAAAVLFIIKGGYSYMMSQGDPDGMADAKKTIRNAVIGFIILVSASFMQALLNHAFTAPVLGTTTPPFNLTPIQPVPSSGGLVQALLDTYHGFLENIVRSITKPLTDAVLSFLTTTPVLSTNSVIFNFWLIILGITDSLFALGIALLGFHFMSASALGFDELEFKHLLPRIGLAFLLANTSIFLADAVIQTCNVLVQALLHATGGIGQAWVFNALDPAVIFNNAAAVPLIALIFMVVFVILTFLLLLFYISRLIVVALGAVMSPIIFLMWTLPKFSDFAEISIKSYLVAVFTVFVHVVIIQLASAFLTIPGQVGANPLFSIVVGIGLLVTLLKTSSMMMQFMFYSTGSNVMKKVGRQVMNVITSQKTDQAVVQDVAKKTARKVVRA